MSGTGRRVLVTGADTFWGGRCIQALESDPGTDVVLGLGTEAPIVAFEHAEYVRCDQAYSLLSKIVRATHVDTIVHTSLVVDSTLVSPRALHERNVIGTMNLLAAAGAAGSSVRHLVVKSSTLVYGSSPRDPATFTEDSARSSPPRTRMERSLVEVESLVRDFSEDNPDTAVAILRFANVLGTDLVTPISKDLSRPLCPSIAGFDPVLQFVEEADVVRALDHATRRRLAGTFNVAGAGRLPWSEVAGICGTRRVPLSPWHPAWAIEPARRLGFWELPPELEALLRYGRGVDTTRFLDTGFRFQFTSAGAVESFVRGLRLRHSVGRPVTEYTYEHDVEQFFRHSPSVVRDEPASGDARRA